jgi:hypothetical protein
MFRIIWYTVHECHIFVGHAYQPHHRVYAHNLAEIYTGKGRQQAQIDAL